MISLSSEEAAAWREQWIADIQRRARVEVPALMRSARAQRLQHLTDTGTAPKIAVVLAPATPIPESAPGLPETGGIPRLRETAMISAIKLFRPAIDVRKTSELVSQAVLRFFARHGYLPNKCRLSSMRMLTIEHPDLYPLNDQAADLGCYTISIEEEENFPIDAVRLLAQYGGVATREDYAF